MNTKAFTIIEVLISVIILATVATMLFDISLKSKDNYTFYKKKLSFENLSSLAISRELSNTNLYEQLKTEYNIKDDELRKELKQIKFKTDTKSYSSQKLTDEITLNITQEQIISKKGSNYYFHVGIR